MTTKAEWQQAYRALRDEQRAKVPPSTDEEGAPFFGELEGEEADDVREWLAANPEAARALTAPFPESAEGLLSDDERAADLAAIRERVGLFPPGPSPIPLPFHAPRTAMRFLAVAAAILVVLGIGGYALLHTRPDNRVAGTRLLLADGSRGGNGTRGGSAEPSAELMTGRLYELKPLYRPLRAYRQYRLELFDAATSPPNSVWHQDNVTRQPDGSYPIRLATDDLTPGNFELVLFGIDDQADRLATYSLRVDRP